MPSPPPGKREGKKRKVSFLLLLPKEERNGAPLPTFFHSEKRQGEAGDSPSPGMDGGGGCGAVAGNQYFSLYLGALAAPFYAFFPSLSLSCKNDVSRIFPSRSDTATSLRRHPFPPKKKLLNRHPFARGKSSPGIKVSREIPKREGPYIEDCFLG